MIRRWATDTSVSVAKSQAELEVLLDRNDAEPVMLGSSSIEVVIGWLMRKRKIIFRMMLPNPKSDEFKRTPTRNKVRTRQQAHAWKQACRFRHHARPLCITAKLEVVAVRIMRSEEEFLEHIQMPDGRLVADNVIPNMTLDNWIMSPDSSGRYCHPSPATHRKDK
ncbi:MAG: hypothetical protein AAF732_11090 [Pseudomonadota bacterium]